MIVTMSNYFHDGVYQPILDPTFQNAQQQQQKQQQQQYYQGQLPQLFVSTPEQSQSWNPSQRPRLVLQRPQSVQGTRDQVHSPATSAHTVQTTSDTLNSDGLVYRQPDSSLTNNRISFSQQNSSYMLSPTCSSSLFDPSAREEPWSSFHRRNVENRRARCPSRQSNAEFPQYQYPRVGSDIDSSVLPSDSGYLSIGTSQSVLGNESDLIDQPLSSEFVNRIQGMNVESTAGSVTAGSCIPSDQRSHIGSTRSRKSTSMQIKCDYPGCKETFKCNSEHKKHKRKHDKPFRCTEPDCKRYLEGFTTTNDLDRHRKSVHQVDVRSNSYKCAGRNCRNKEKVWPRLDNFKQHVKHMHPSEDTADVIERSKLHSDKQPSYVDDESAVAHMGASLVLDGMDKSLPSYPAMASSSPVEPPVKRYQQDRSSVELNSGVIKEECTKPHFLDETSFVTLSANHQEQHVQRRALGLSSTEQTQISLPSDIPMDPPSRKNIPHVSQSNVDYGLSNAPQIKAEQQRMARKRSVATPSPTGPTDIGHILSLLQQANNSVKQDNESTEKVPSTSSDSDAIVLSKRDAMELVKLLQAAQAAPRQTDRPRQRICPHPDCGQTATRACDMRKHLKRHEKPYGCTYPKCYKRFGAKSDWKRHENNQHFQPEAFRCVFETFPGAVCGDHTHQLGMFKVHLKAHSITSRQIAEDLIQRSKIGKNCQETFWCGLCKAVIPLKTRRNAAWDERFDHIAHHLEKEKKSIEDWVCVEQNRPKKELEEEQKRAAREVEDDKEKDDESESGGDDEDAVDTLPQSWTPVPTMPDPPPPPSFGPESSRKREAPSDNTDDADRRGKPKRRKPYIRFCCSCHNGPYGPVQAACVECTHILCSSCNCLTEEFMMELYE